MNLQEALSEIETTQFATRLNAASDFRTFVFAARNEPAVQFLLAQPDRYVGSLVNRIVAIASRESDVRYENRWDTAVAAYLWILSLKNRSVAKTAATIVARIPRCWWAEKLAQDILLDVDRVAASGSSENISAFGHFHPPDTMQVQTSGVLVISTGFFPLPSNLVIGLAKVQSTNRELGTMTVSDWPIHSQVARVDLRNVNAND